MRALNLPDAATAGTFATTPLRPLPERRSTISRTVGLRGAIVPGTVISPRGAMRVAGRLQVSTGRTFTTAGRDSLAPCVASPGKRTRTTERLLGLNWSANDPLLLVVPRAIVLKLPPV